ncbi:hypothetical protein GURASL_36260 [Geotalea uraniireducens]|uniref:DUF2269 domain-containing protein n=1 Tax=Geotalea uraniireducens TaxID=351604 RepID=A0ABN6VWD5_9BACT|nr:DUF2269 family protein [Geotalea uraniireducens]BDV44703.1 hypothetical protein GURASL_36260 [Geotalea uraniireducens]
MQITLQAGQQTRLLLKYLHTFSAMMWIGGAQAILILLYKDRQAANGDELFAVNDAIRSLDNWLIGPGVIGSIVSGGLICLTTNWGFFRHRWVVVKWVVTAVATAFGVFFLGPWLEALSALTGLNRLAVFDNGAYVQTYRLGVAFGIAQTVVLLLLVLLSIVKPDFGPAPGEGRRGIPPALRPLLPVIDFPAQLCSLFRQEHD